MSGNKRPLPFQWSSLDKDDDKEEEEEEDYSKPSFYRLTKRARLSVFKTMKSAKRLVLDHGLAVELDPDVFGDDLDPEEAILVITDEDNLEGDELDLTVLFDHGGVKRINHGKFQVNETTYLFELITRPKDDSFMDDEALLDAIQGLNLNAWINNNCQILVEDIAKVANRVVFRDSSTEFFFGSYEEAKFAECFDGLIIKDTKWRFRRVDGPYQYQVFMYNHRD